MSAKLVGRALEMRGLSKAEKLILIGLADCSNSSTGACYPSISWLAAVAEVSERHAVRCVKELESLRLIRVDRRPGRSSDYVIFPVDDLGSTPDTMTGPTPDTMTGVEMSPLSPRHDITPGGSDIAMSGGSDTAMSPEPERTLREERAREAPYPPTKLVEDLRERLRDGHHHWRPGGPDGKCAECHRVVSEHSINEKGEVA